MEVGFDAQTGGINYPEIPFYEFFWNYFGSYIHFMKSLIYMRSMIVINYFTFEYIRVWFRFILIPIIITFSVFTFRSSAVIRAAWHWNTLRKTTRSNRILLATLRVKEEYRISKILSSYLRIWFINARGPTSSESYSPPVMVPLNTIKLFTLYM